MNVRPAPNPARDRPNIRSRRRPTDKAARAGAARHATDRQKLQKKIRPGSIRPKSMP